MKVLSVPHVDNLGKGESGINTVIRNYFRYLPVFGVEFVPPASDNFDILHVHAGMTTNYPRDVNLVSSLHGLYWTADYNAPDWEWAMNAKIVKTVRNSSVVTVPSQWVAETLRRDMHLNPEVVTHGVDWESWQHDYDNSGYVIAYAKNRAWADVSIPAISTDLARKVSDVLFTSTFAQKPVPRNMRVTGALEYQSMKRMVQGAAVFVSPVKETFGIAPLEAMAAGVPVLTVDAGQVPSIVGHGRAGYCYEDGNIEDMIEGLRYCLQYREVLGRNARELAREWTWEKAAQNMYGAYEIALLDKGQGDISVIIPVYNKEVNQLERAIDSVLDQTRQARRVVVVDDGSRDGEPYRALCQERGVDYIRQENRGVAHARNAGIAAVDTEYVCCLDADDAIAPRFLEICASALDKNRSKYIAYSKLKYTLPNGNTGVSTWPGEYNFDKFLKRQNQVPTCSVFRRIVWERLGGFRQRYAPTGAGAEDAEFYFRAGSRGYSGILASEDPMFLYTMGSGHTSDPDYREVDWLHFHAPELDGNHGIASLATPKRYSHPARQYDEPDVSIIVPVGPGHEEIVIDALDSIEAQTFLKWEAIVVWDSPNPIPQSLWDGYPFVHWSIIQGSKSGAGVARNRGASMADGKFLLFLDADDWLDPKFLEIALQAWQDNKAGIYTDYLGVAEIGDVSKLAEDLQRGIVSRDDRTGRTAIRYKASEYRCEVAIKQPIEGTDPYIWNNITTLIPRAWHKEIGGFDEEMESWEDIDYWWRLARAGKCFVRIPEPLMTYRFATGGRRDLGLRQRSELLEYLDRKRREDTVMGCGCSGGKTADPLVQRQINAVRSINEMDDENFVMARYLSANRGQHPVIGASTKRNYQYRAGGEKFLVHKDDIAAQPHLFMPVEAVEKMKVEAPKVEREPVPVPEPVQKPARPLPDQEPQNFDTDYDATPERESDEDNMAEIERILSQPSTPLDLSQLNLRKDAIQSLARAGVVTEERAKELGVEGLSELKWIGEKTATEILEMIG